MRALRQVLARAQALRKIEIAPAPINRVFFVQVAPLSINTVGEDDERLDYRLRVSAGGDCDAIPPDAPGVTWPRIMD